VAYSENVIANTEFLSERAVELADQEIERARALDTKAGGVIAGSVALIAAGAGFANKLEELSGGTGAKTLWAVELSVASALLLVAGALAVWAVTPRAFRTPVALHVLKGWVTPRVLEQDPTAIRGSLLRADVKSIGVARDVNNDKAKRLAFSFFGFAAALACIVALGISVGIRASQTGSNRDGSHRPVRSADVRVARSRHGAS
jgi:hypothetical protein